MKNRKNTIKNIIIIVCVIILILIVSIYFYIYKSGKNFMNNYKYKVYPSTYIMDKDISGMSDKELSNYLVNIEEKIKNIKININVNDKNYNYVLDDLGIYINKDEVIKSIIYKEEKKSLQASIRKLFDNTKEKYNYKIIYSEVGIKDFVNNLKKKVDIEGLSGSLKMTNGNLSYEGYQEGYNLNKENLISTIEKEIYKTLKDSDIDEIKVINIKATGEKIDKSDKDLSSINTKISSFKARYYHNNNRDMNLKIAINSIDKVILMPKEEFSFFDYAGPYDKTGYMFYEDMIGNGVCEVSTVLYNAILLSGIKATERNPHSDVTEYVPGGMDSMVASLDGKSLSDFKFKNTLNYPIYISAYLTDTEVCVDIWSNENATNGYTYKTDSIKINSNTYDSYLYKYKDNQLIDTIYIARDYYSI